jgi:hypothetical protein
VPAQWVTFCSPHKRHSFRVFFFASDGDQKEETMSYGLTSSERLSFNKRNVRKREVGCKAATGVSCRSHGLKIPVLDTTAWPDEPWRTRQYVEATKKFQPSISGTMLVPQGDPGHPRHQRPENIFRDLSLTIFKPYEKVEMDDEEKSALR